jgi:hypothetical protein
MKITWYGYHKTDVPELDLQDKIIADKLFFAQGLLYDPVLGLVKWSIILFLLRLDDRRKGIWWTLMSLQAFNLAHMISVFLVVVFQCSPADMYWNHHKTDLIIGGQVVNDDYTCIDQASFSLSTAAIAVLTDIAILLVPIAMMWNHQMPIRRKLAVIFVLSLGWIVAVVGIIRIDFFIDFWYGRFPDPSWSPWHTLSGVENNVAIMVSCGPGIQAFVTHYFPRFCGISSGSRSTGNMYYTPGGHELPSWSRASKSMANATQGRTTAVNDSTEAIVRSESPGKSVSGYGSETFPHEGYQPPCPTLK